MRVSGAEFVYGELRKRILALEIAPDSRVLEEVLADEYGVSRTPVRQAVHQLLAEGLLERRRSGGLFAPALDAAEIGQLYDVRASLEALMAGEAARVASEEGVSELRALLLRNAALIAIAEEALQAGEAIHSAIADIAGNVWATRLHGQVIEQMRRYRRFSNNSEARRQAALTDHQSIVDAIAAGDAERAGRLAQQHVLAARDEVVRAIGVEQV